MHRHCGPARARWRARARSAATGCGAHPTLLSSLALPAGARHHRHSNATRHDTRARTHGTQCSSLRARANRRPGRHRMTEPPKLEDLGSRGDPGVARIDRFGAEDARSGARALPARAADRLHPPQRRLPAVQAEHRLRQHASPPDAGAGVSGRPRPRAAHRGLHPLECDGHGARRPTRRPPSTAGTSPATPPRRRSTRWASIISGAPPPTSIPATWCSCRAHSSPGIYARAYLEGRLTEEQLKHFRQEVGAPAVGLSSYPHPVADAGLLAVPDRLDGPRSDDGHLPGALHALPGAPRPRRRPRIARSGASCGDGEMDEPESMGALTMPVREKLDNLIFVDQLQPAAPRWPGARQRQDHPGARGGVPRRRLERHQGAVGLALGSAAGARHTRACCGA